MKNGTVKFYLVGTKKISDESVAKSYSDSTQLPIKVVFEEEDIINSAEELDRVLKIEQAEQIKGKSRLLTSADYKFIADNIDLFLTLDNQLVEKKFSNQDDKLTVRDAMKDGISTRALGCMRSKFSNEIEISYREISDLPINVFYERIASLNCSISSAKKIRNMGQKSIQWAIENARGYGIQNLFIE